MAKKTPAWQIMGLAEQPPADRHGYIDYGTVWSPAMASRREPLSYAVRLALWSWAYWGKKVRKDILAFPSVTPVMRAADRVMLALVATVTWAHERAGSPKG
jgi:hypothetical protein